MAENPWLAIPVADYEGHMAVAGQLAPLSAIFGEELRRLLPARVALLGCAAGNGLEQVDLSVTRRLLAIDVNPDYVELTRERHGARLGASLEVRCADLERWPLPRGEFDLVHAALLLEHADEGKIVPNLAQALAPGGRCVVVLQLPSAAAAITPSPFASIHRLEPSFHLLPPAQIDRLMDEQGLALEQSRTAAIPNGKELFVATYFSRSSLAK